MYYVYILYSERHGKSYVGFTGNLEQRLLSHNVLSNKDWTKRYRPWVLVYHETFSSKAGAMEREKFYKTGQGRQFVKAKIDEFLNRSPLGSYPP